MSILDPIHAVINVVEEGFVSREVRNHRYSLCELCEHFNGTFCSICKCWMRVKVWVPAACCPLESPKWKQSPGVHQNNSFIPSSGNISVKCGSCGK